SSARSTACRALSTMSQASRRARSSGNRARRDPPTCAAGKPGPPAAKCPDGCDCVSPCLQAGGSARDETKEKAMKRRNLHLGKASVAVLLLAVVVWTAVAPTQAAADRDINILIGSTSTLGSSLDASELRQLLKGEEEIDAQELADFSADKVVFSDIRLLVDDVELPDGTTMSQTVHYRDVELKDVVDGIAGSLTIGSTTTETPTLTLQAGELTMEDF